MLQAVQMAIDGALWLPFLLTIDRRMCKEESRKIARNALQTITKATESKKGAKVEASDDKAPKAKTTPAKKKNNTSKKK